MDRNRGTLTARDRICSQRGRKQAWDAAARPGRPHAARSRTWPGRRVVRFAAVCLSLLVSLDLFLVGLLLVGRPAHPEISRRFAVETQASAFRAVADRTREEWAGFRKRLEERAARAR